MQKSLEKTISREEFMQQVGMSFGAILLTACVTSCETTVPDPVTGGDKFKVVLDLNVAANAPLKTPGGSVIFTSGNFRIIAAQTKDGNMLAVAGNCTHANNDLKFDENSNNFNCPLHGSQFTSSGSVAKGPATSALKKYIALWDKTAQTVTISES